MRAVVQRVRGALMHATRSKAGEPIDVKTTIEHGLVVLLCAQRGDTTQEFDWVADKIARLRIFDDADGKMNRSVLDVGGSVMVVSQFTLAGDAAKGNRPSFVDAQEPAKASELVERCATRLESEHGLPVARGVFGATMRVELVNDGPVTLILERHAKE